MYAESLSGLDIDKYGELLRDEFGLAITVATVDAKGSMSIADSADSRMLSASFLQEHLSSSAPSNQQVSKHYLTETQLLLSCDLESGIDDAVTALMLCQAESQVIPRAAENAAHIVFESVLDALRLTNELDQMADDLAARYEELNLFYGLDEIVETSEQEQGQEALKKLLEQCSEYLNAKVATLIIPSAHIDVEIEFGDSSAFNEGWQTVKERLKGQIYRTVADQGQVVIVNRCEDTLAATDSELSGKIAALPVLGRNADMLGVLSLLRDEHQPDFSNGDRRLLKIVTEQAATIIGGSFDLLTGLLCREGMESPVNVAIADHEENEHTLLIVDIDQFKMINDACGRKAGDELLKRVARRLKAMTYEGDAVGRIAGDEFCVLLKHTNQHDAQDRADELVKQLIGMGFRWGSSPFDLSIGVGIVPLGAEIEDANEAFVIGNIACGIAKKKGRGGTYIYDCQSDLIQSVRSTIDWIPKVREALDNNLFELYGQGILGIQGPENTLHHFEILLRLRDENGRAGSPFQMIKAAESYNIASKIDRWVVVNAFKALQASRELYPQLNVSFSINLSGQSINDEFFGFLKEQLIDAPDLIPYICFEITETAMVANLSTSIPLIESLRNMGVKFSLDDFGTGMSSFSYLRNLPVDYLKIDGSFVKHIVEDKVSYAMVESIHRVGDIMNLETIAEYAENDEVVEKIREIGIHYGQGYGLNKPAPIAEQLALLAEQNQPAVSRSGTANY